jgi:hypothetical protein
MALVRLCIVSGHPLTINLEIITVLTDHPVPAGLRKFYFEVEIKSLDENDGSK